MKAGEIRILAVASGGGHWAQLIRLSPAWSGFDVAYATTNNLCESDGSRALGSWGRCYIIPDANRSKRLALIRQFFNVAAMVSRERPDVVVTTGASLGYFALIAGKIFGARTIWVDSIANAEELSLSGRHARRFADLWLTQWPELADPKKSSKGRRPLYRGAVL